MGEEIHEDDLTAMFENIDVNHDGQIDIHELVAIFEGDLHVGEDDIL
jgi:Ca2+-binding EF-hand superfamily protein